MIATGNVREVTDGDLFLVEKIIVHESYDNFLYHNDIALLKTDTAIQFNDNVKPISLATSSPPVRSKAVASGWGLTSVDPQTVPNTLQFLEVNVLSNDDCIQKLEPTGHSDMIYSGNICTLNTLGEGMCLGDSGGPLVANNELIGLVSWGFPCAKGRPDIFTRVSEFSDWVNDTMTRF